MIAKISVSLVSGYIDRPYKIGIREAGMQIYDIWTSQQHYTMYNY